ncbi:MAG: hypothetical protein P1V36_14775, partial [Planctomycetota bacterium]|nr:hypothetical protein [Planctomycetota bacterium]
MFRYSHAPLRRLPLLAALLLACLLGVPRPAASESKDVLPLKVLTDIVVDGVPGEAGWKAAPKIIFPTVTVPDAVAPAGIARAPDVRVGLAAGRLAFGVTMAEAPGGSIGMHLLIAPEGAKSAADAVSLDFRPVELRAPRYRVLGPRGVGRTTYRVEGAADISQARQWSLELAIPLADLVGTRTDQKLRVAAVVYTRTQNVISVWPAGATWKGPAHWTEVEPPEGGWPLDVQV